MVKYITKILQLNLNSKNFFPSNYKIKRTISNTAINSEIFTKLNINREIILYKRNNNLVQDLINTLNKLNIDLKNILENDELSLEMKQKQLEKL